MSPDKGAGVAFAGQSVQLAKPLRRTFRLHQGIGSIRVRLPKPPGRAEPLSYLDYGTANKSCRSVRSQLRDRSRTFDLRVSASCGRAAGNAMAHLYVGGLLG